MSHFPLIPSPPAAAGAADAALKAGTLHGCLNPALLKPNMTVLDVSDPPVEHDLFAEARLRGCRLVEPAAVYEIESEER